MIERLILACFNHFVVQCPGSKALHLILFWFHPQFTNALPTQQISKKYITKYTSTLEEKKKKKLSYKFNKFGFFSWGLKICQISDIKLKINK